MDHVRRTHEVGKFVEKFGKKTKEQDFLEDLAYVKGYYQKRYK
jgi:hypothetical protein